MADILYRNSSNPKNGVNDPETTGSDPSEQEFWKFLILQQLVSAAQEIPSQSRDMYYWLLNYWLIDILVDNNHQ